jgi:hypothetical protein
LFCSVAVQLNNNNNNNNNEGINASEEPTASCRIMKKETKGSSKIFGTLLPHFIASHSRGL